MTSLCKYKNLFGEAGKTTGIRKYRILGISIIDVVVVILFAYLIARAFRLPFIITTFAIFLLGILVHRLFCVKTAVDIALFGNVQ
jgi:hypothetical protein